CARASKKRVCDYYESGASRGSFATKVGRSPEPSGTKAAMMKVSLLVTCLGDALFPEVGTATVRLLHRLGVDVDFPASQTCCGQPHFNSGYHNEARDLARHTIQAFDNGQLVVTPSG